MVKFLYNGMFIPIIKASMPLLMKKMPKLREREEAFAASMESVRAIPGSAGKRVWFHAASMGEFEQAKPIIEEIRSIAPETVIICSFYSPSGYNNQKNYSFADAICYMPLDTPAAARNFIELVRPDCAVFIRYELWLNHLSILSQKSIPSFLACATRPSGKFLPKCYLKKALNCFSEIYTVGKEHTGFFGSLGISPAITTLSDTRFDRIAAKVSEASGDPILPHGLFDAKSIVLVAGSSWPPDEEIIIPAVRALRKESGREIRVIYVPHEPTEGHLANLESRLDSSIRLSLLQEIIANDGIGTAGEAIRRKDIVVDSIGKLLRLYANASAAYIGGAFGAGVHSVTEPAGYGIPLATGPGMDNSYDALNLRSKGALTIVHNAAEMKNWLESAVLDDKKRKLAGAVSSDYIFSAIGSSNVIAKAVLKAAIS